MKIELLISLLKDETKRSVESTGCNGMFYATVLKPPETDFGNCLRVTFKNKYTIGPTIPKSK